MINMVKTDVSYRLDINLRSEIINIRNLIKKILKSSEIYLFGSVAKGRYSKNSDIDILILIYENKSLKELRMLRHDIEDNIEKLSLDKSVDIKIYSKERFLELSNNPCFEREIISDLVDIMGW